MTGIELYSKTAASNNSSPPNGWPEGQAPSTVNDCARQMMAAIRTWYEDAQWINFGYTHVYVASTQFKIVGTDVTSIYTVGRRVKAVGSSTGTIFGSITVSAFSTDTTITVSWDSGSLSNETLTVSVGILTLTNGASPTSAPFIDSTAIIKGSSDATKLFRIEVDGNTTGTTRVMTSPDADFTAVGTATTQTITNKSFVDASTFIVDDGDATKKLVFECSGITTGTTRTASMPDKSGTLAMTSDLTGVVLATAQATTSGTSKDFTIPITAKRICALFNAVSTNGSSNLLVQIGAGGTPTTSGYSSNANWGGTQANSTAGFLAINSGAGSTNTGTMILSNISGNIWVESGLVMDAAGAGQGGTNMGVVTLGGALNFVRFTTVNGTDAFDAGSVTIQYE